MKCRNASPDSITLIAVFCVFAALFFQGCSKSSAPTNSGSTSGTTTGGSGKSTSSIEPVDSFIIPEEGKAKTIIEKSGVNGGLIVHINCGNGVLTDELKTNDSCLIQGLDSAIGNVQTARQYILSREHYGPVSVSEFTGSQLPYIDNLANLVVSERLGDISLSEVMRILAPNGVAIIKGDVKWYKYLKSWPTEMDEWNHYLYNSSGNPVSLDKKIAPIKHYQWIGSPRWARHHDTTASMSALVSANGRIFYIMDEGPTESIELPAKNYLVARDAFNGAILWKRTIPEWQDQWFALKSGPAYLPRRLVAAGNRVFVTLGINAPLSELNAATGEIIRTFPQTEQTSEVLFADDTLFLLIGRPEKKKETYIPKHTYVWDSADYARTEWAWNRSVAQIKAINISDGSVLWKKDYVVAPLSLTADANSVYFFDGTRLISVNRQTGQEAWRSETIQTRAFTTAYAPRVIAYKTVVLFSNGLQSLMAFNAVNGRKIWQSSQAASGHYSPEDIFVINDVVWTGATANVQSDGTFTGRDIYTGVTRRSIRSDVDIYFFHQRCYPSKATEKFILPSRTGIEFVNLEQQHWTVNHYARGGCFYGVMPSNGLIYAPPNACACYMEAKLNGFGALAGAYDSEPDINAAAAEIRLEKGPAYGAAINDDADSEDWPTYRHDAKRSSYTASFIASNVSPLWQLKLGGKLTSPVVAGNRMYFSKINAHTVYAVDANAGHVLWSYTVGGRVDSPPTVYKGRVLFGSADGYVYCLRAEDGILIWRFRAAPIDRRMMAYEQLESVWPVSGSVLIQNDKVYCIAGRSMFLDGGMRLVQLNPLTGEKLSESVLDENDPVTGNNLHSYVQGLDMPVALPDILSSDGKYVYMRSQQFDLSGNRRQIAVRNVQDQLGEGAHVFSPVGFLDDTQFVRSYMMYGKSVKGGWGGWEVMGKFVPSGRLIAVDDQAIYGYERKPEFLSESMVLEFQLYAADKMSNVSGIQRIMQLLSDFSDPFNPSFMNYAGDWKLRQGIPKADQTAVNYKWLVDKPPLQVRAMALADKTLFIAGPPDVVDEEAAFFALDDATVLEKLAEQSALLEGKGGAVLWAVSTIDGQKLAECQLDSLPAWDGMIVAGGKLYLTTMNGDALCFSDGIPRTRTANRNWHSRFQQVWNKLFP
jgi:outer membrane protein assembly factor BamB